MVSVSFLGWMYAECLGNKYILHISTRLPLMHCLFPVGCVCMANIIIPHIGMRKSVMRMQVSIILRNAICPQHCSGASSVIVSYLESAECSQHMPAPTKWKHKSRLSGLETKPEEVHGVHGPNRAQWTSGNSKEQRQSGKQSKAKRRPLWSYYGTKWRLNTSLMSANS